jgi:hypothetical protein
VWVCVWGATGFLTGPFVAQYSMMTQTANIDNTGFPSGYFIIRSVASERLLDVTMGNTEDGTELGLWPEKEKSLVDSQYLSNLFGG